MIRAASKLTEFPINDLARLMIDAREPNSSGDLLDSVVFFLFEKDGLVVDTDDKGKATSLSLSFGMEEVKRSRTEQQLREALGTRIPETIRRRIQSLSPDRVHWVDPVLGITDEDLPVKR